MPDHPRADEIPVRPTATRVVGDGPDVVQRASFVASRDAVRWGPPTVLPV